MAAVDVTVRVPGPGPGLAAVFRGDPARWLPAPARASGVDSWRVAIAAGPLEHEVVCTVGDPWVRGEDTSRSLQWEPTAAAEALVPPERALPLLVGTLTLHELDGAVELHLTGRTTPPAGALGRFADTLGLRRVASHTARRFCTDVAVRLAARIRPAV